MSTKSRRSEKKKNSVNSTDSTLTPDEVSHLCEVMLRAKKFDDEECVQVFEGQLSKYTNVVKGWQYRWFVINSSRGTLEYYMVEDKKKTTPRGFVVLVGCQIVPSEDDSQTFTVISTCGEVYKLKAIDAKERQVWVNRLRLSAQNLECQAKSISTDSLSHSSASFPPKSSVVCSSQLNSNLFQSFDSVEKQIQIVEKSHNAIVDAINKIRSTDQNLLLIKASSGAALYALEESFSILEALQ